MHTVSARQTRVERQVSTSVVTNLQTWPRKGKAINELNGENIADAGGLSAQVLVLHVIK